MELTKANDHHNLLTFLIFSTHNFYPITLWLCNLQPQLILQNGKILFEYWNMNMV